VGRVRRENEDAYGLYPDLGLYVVADGIGGHLGGRVASAMVAEAIHQAVVAPGGQPEQRDRRPGVSAGRPVVAERLLAAVEHANQRVHEAGREPSREGMGSTVAAALFDRCEGSVAICHVGDSRVYRLRAGALEQLTDDHTLVREWLREGKITSEEAATSPHRHIITRALGARENVEPSLRIERLEEGDVFLLTSDGIHDLVEPDEIARAMRGAGGDLAGACRRLIELANERGGTDNSTAVVLHCQAPPDHAARGEGPTPA